MSLYINYELNWINSSSADSYNKWSICIQIQHFFSLAYTLLRFRDQTESCGAYVCHFLHSFNFPTGDVLILNS